MYRTSRRPAARQRRAVILLVVITLLTLFAAVGLTFMLYAESEATASRIYRERQDAAAVAFTGEDPNYVFSYALGQLIYDVPDDANGVQSSLRGHSLARSMFGYNSGNPGGNTLPFSGTGRLHIPGLFGQDDYNLVNYKYFPGDPIRDPERPNGTRNLPTDPVTASWVGGFHAPYTYPDLNNMYLAAVRGDDTVLAPSFHRPWLFGPLNPGNGNWNNAHGKYLTLRPRPADHSPAFPYPSDATGDVKNMVGAPGGNDSIWIDLGYPVRQFKDGAGSYRYYKPLFAFLVRDLDSLVNVNAHGNIVINQAAHASHQGWGKWEVNLGKVLAADATEWTNLFRGNGAVAGRYGSNLVPGGTPPMDAAPVIADPNNGNPINPPLYSFFNFNAATDPPTGLGGWFDLPGEGSHAGTASFPRYTTARGWSGGNPLELSAHPAAFDLYQTPVTPGANGGDRVFDVTEIRKLFSFSALSASDLAGSDVARLCPLNLNDPGNPLASARRRHLITTHSFDLDAPGVLPMTWNPLAQPLQLTAGAAYPTGGAVPFPTDGGANPPGATPPGGSEFGPDWRALSATLARLDLNRPLRPFPNINQGTFAGPAQAVQDALTDRQNLARDIFIRLCAATGTPCTFSFNGTPQGFPGGITAEQVNAARWLAQLAVNIVDFIDADDVMTPFNWNPSANGAGSIDAVERGGWVIGTELNRVVLNEVYIEYVNDPNDPDPVTKKATRPYQVKIWAELYNPLPGVDTALSDLGKARFKIGNGMNAYPAYQLLVTRANTALRNPDNVRGQPDAATLTTLNDWTGSPPLADMPDMNPGDFRLIGPKFNKGADDLPGTVNSRNDFSSDQLVYQSGAAAPADPEPPTLLLQRLACPYLAPQPNPNQPFYNPYVTVDVVDMRDPDPNNVSQQINKAIDYDPNGPVANPTPDKRSSWGRLQPYAAHNSVRVRQTVMPANTKEPQHTFKQHNNPRAGSFDWLVFRDRPLINAAELLDVPAFKPHEITQQFVIDGNKDGNVQPGEKFLHRAPWTDPSARIYRVLEWLTTRDRAAGMNLGGRFAGRVNINTIYDPETFNALADANGSNRFTQADVNAAWMKLVQQRTPGLVGAPPQLSANDRPFKGLAAPYTSPGQQYPAGCDIKDTVVGGVLNQATAQPHPNLDIEMLIKLFPNLTTRSNVFAVWMTVGYFEVVDNSNPNFPKLGAEFQPNGTVVRQRAFALVDRTGLSLFSTNNAAPDQVTTLAGAVNGGSGNPYVPPGVQTVNLQSVSGPLPGGGTWSILPGTLLRIDTGVNQEVVTVLSVAGNAITAHFSRNHPANTRVAILGNPGPQPGFNWTNGTRYGQVVLDFQILN